MATTPTIQRPGSFSPQQDSTDEALTRELWTETTAKGRAPKVIENDEALWDVNVSRANLYAGTVLEQRPFLAQQMLMMLRPTLSNPMLLMTDVFMGYIFMADYQFRRKARKKSKACTLASRILEEENSLRELLQSYRSALYSG